VPVPKWQWAKKSNSDGEEQILEHALRADYALVKADLGDRWGNLTYGDRVETSAR